MKSINLSLLAASLLLCMGQAMADTPIDQSRKLDADAHVSIDNVKGEVTVTAWDRNQIRITGTLGSGAQPLKVSGDSHDLSIKVQGPSSSGWFSWGNDTHMGPTALNIQVPSGVSLSVDVVSAEVSMSGLKGGRIDIDTVSGPRACRCRKPFGQRGLGQRQRAVGRHRETGGSGNRQRRCAGAESDPRRQGADGPPVMPGSAAAHSRRFRSAPSPATFSSTADQTRTAMSTSTR